MFLIRSKSNFCQLDIDECLEYDPFPCDPNADCTDLDGSYLCECRDGYSGNGEICEGNVTFQIFHLQLNLEFWFTREQSGSSVSVLA